MGSLPDHRNEVTSGNQASHMNFLFPSTQGLEHLRIWVSTEGSWTNPLRTLRDHCINSHTRPQLLVEESHLLPCPPYTPYHPYSETTSLKNAHSVTDMKRNRDFKYEI